jgi:hypothetical protein
VVEYLPNKYETLGSISNTERNSIRLFGAMDEDSSNSLSEVINRVVEPSSMDK